MRQRMDWNDVSTSKSTSPSAVPRLQTMRTLELCGSKCQVGTRQAGSGKREALRPVLPLAEYACIYLFIYLYYYCHHALTGAEV